MSDELKPCPFCQEVPVPEDADGALHKGNDCWIGTVFIQAHEFDEWNRRADLSRPYRLPPEQVERLKSTFTPNGSFIGNHDPFTAQLLRDILAAIQE